MTEQTPAPEPAEPSDPLEPSKVEPEAEHADQAPDDFQVTEQTPIERDAVNREVGGMVGGTTAGNIHNVGQTALGAGAMAAEAILLGTFNVGRETKGWSGVFPEAEIDRLCSVYARGPSDADLALCLKERSVVYLSAPPGWGRHAAARVALAGRHASDRVAMISIAPGQRVVDALGEGAHFLEDHGHVIDATAARSIDVADLLEVGKQVGAKSATAVVIGPRAERGHDLGQFLFEHRRPASIEVFRAQLTFLLGKQGRSAEVEGWVTHQVVLRHLNGALPLEDAARLAEVVSVAPDGVVDFVQRWLLARARLILRAAEDEPREDQRPWSGTPEYRRAFRLAFAALEGSPLSAAYEAADLLLRVQRNEPPDGEPEPQVEVEFDGLLSYGMQAPGWGPTRAGEPRLAWLANPELARALLDVAWNERAMGTSLVRWLDNLAVHPVRAVRRRAALLAGLLCFTDFDGVLNGLVAKWAQSSRKGLREAAGMSLLSCSYNPELLGGLTREVERWVDGPMSTNFRRDSIAWAYAYGLGAQLPYDGLRRLRRIAKDAWQRRSLLVATGVDGSCTQDRAEQILDELRDWLVDQDHRLRTHAARAFVRLARRRRSGRPELLDRGREGLLREAQLVEPWSAALSMPATASSAWAELTAWLDGAEHEPELADPFVRLTRALVRDQGLRDRLAHQCRHVWQEQRSPNPLLAAVAARAWDAALKAFQQQYGVENPK